jgi:hypothetical protein
MKTTTKRSHDHTGSSPHPMKRCKQQEFEAFSVMTSHGLDLHSCFTSSVPEVTASNTIHYDFSDLTSTPQASHVPDTQESVSYPFLEFLGTGAVDAGISLAAHQIAATSSMTDPTQFASTTVASCSSPAVTTTPLASSSKVTMSRPHSAPQQPHREAIHLVHQSHEVGPPSQDGDPSEAEHHSDGLHSASTAAEDSESSRRQADRAARNRESSRRAREKAKGRLKSLEAEVLVLREHCRRYKVQMDSLAQQAARGQCGMCGCVIPNAPSGAAAMAGHPHAHLGHAQQAYLQPPQDQTSSMANTQRR